MTEHETESKGPLSDLLDLVVHKSVGDFVDWDVAEAVNGHRFPTDYMEFIAHLGEGSFEESLGIRLPALAASDTEGRVCPISTEALADPLTGQWTDTDAAAAYTVKDMLIWGETAGADTLCWITSDDDPDAWPIAVYSRGDLAWTVYPCTLTEFILRIIRGDFNECPISDESLLGMESPRFLTVRQEKELMDQGINPWPY
ncbi:hypothetical protein HET69_41220 [Streptomyces sp. CJ_13]|uniref:hypothetical protein n=1 Tax=Streptomyces sp. CJ_13 TaxID=2724943 RepID=UPI001BDCA06E|nr:hypothetical protein [Streptomyces sp. CJ_13]MBT1190225.1 hypothetical protein [Streptomyces sp. CJ_13]